MNTKLPESWVEAKIRDVAKIASGGTPSTSNASYFDGDIPWITPVDLSGYKRKYINKGRRTLSESGLNNSSAKLLPRNTVLFSSRAPIGYVAIAENDLATNQGFKNLLPNEFYDPSYAYYYLKFIKDYAESQASGTTFKELSGSKMGELPFLLAPLKEQKRIADKLDNLYHHLDALNERLDKIPILLKQFRKTLLMQALTGTLTRHLRENHKSEIAKKAQYISIVASTEATIQIPNEWHWSRIGDIAKLINGDRGKNYPHISEYVINGVPFINTGHINPDGTLSDSKMNFITRTKFDILNSGKTKFGDLVYCLRGATLGKTAVVEYLEGAIASSLVIIRPTSLVSSKYLYYFLTSPFGKELIKRYNNGTAQPNLSAKSVRDYPIPLPSLSEQNEIVERIENLFRHANQVEALYHSVRDRITDLPSHILNKAFQGKLVPPYPDDEPASSLLQKITQMKTK